MSDVTHIIAIGNNSWGKATDLGAAVHEWKRNASVHSIRDTVTVQLRAVTADATVDGMGYLTASEIVILPDVTFTAEHIEQIWGGEEVLYDRLEAATDFCFGNDLDDLA